MNASAPSQLELEYQAILQNAWVGILLTRRRVVEHCNPRAAELFGWQQGELIGQPASVLYFSDSDYADMGQQASHLLAAGQLFEQERLMRRRDGSAVHCHLRAKAINPDNSADGTIWILEDIGERKRSESHLRRLLIQQQAILENASVGILFTCNGLIEHCNPRFEELLGYAPGELLGNSAEVFFSSADDYQRFGLAIGARLAAGERIDIEWRNRRRDGSLVWFRHLARALPQAGEEKITIWISDDISQRKAVELELASAHAELERRVTERTEALQRANQRFDAMFRCAPLAIYTRDRQNQVLSWNPAAEAMFGWRADEIMGQTLPMVPEHLHEQCQQQIDAVLAGQTLLQFETERHRRDGSRFEVSLTVAPMPDEQGQVHEFLTLASDITERRLAEQQIAHLAYHDALTGLPNRLLLQDRLQQALAQAEREQQHLALLCLDLDNFKQINDTLGHAAGDVLLQQVTQRLLGCLRDTDTLSRQGGDEFIALLSHLVDQHATLAVLGKITACMEAPFVLDSHELVLSFSIGVALFPSDGRDFDTLLRKADMAMYRAKESGRNSHHFFNDEMGQQAGEHLRLRSGLRRALEQGELQLHYQPQFDLRTGALIGAEALLRWLHPEQGLIAPARFIPIAEESGLIVPIGAWVIEEVCRQGRAWLDAGHPPLLLAVNLSAVQFKRGDLEATLRQALQRSGLPAHLLELELTESLLLHNTQAMLDLVRRLKGMGVKLAIDDFGTGYSSLSYLKRFAVDKLKIDQSFVRDLLTDPDDAAIVRAIIQMAASLGLRTVAEGVETAAVAERIAALGCDEAQGYHYARPMPAAAFTDFLQRTAKIRPNSS